MDHISAIPVYGNFLDLTASEDIDLEGVICKQSEDDEESEAPSENSKSQDDDGVTSSEKDELPEYQANIIKPEPWDRIMKRACEQLLGTFDETCETYLEQNPGMEIEKKQKTKRLTNWNQIPDMQ